MQLRDKDLGGRELLALAERLRAETTARGAALWVNDRVDVALAVEADGVQLGADTLPVEAVRGMLPSWMRMSYSAHAVSEAAACGADLVIFGPVWDTPSKREYGPPQGIERLHEVARAATAPVLAIGGVDPERAREARAAGAHGVAVVRAILAAEDVANATARLLDAVLA